jgi:hypothetical protein
MRSTLALPVMLLASSLAVSPALAERYRGQHEPVPNGGRNDAWPEATHTVTYWCADLNEIWDLDVPVAVARSIFVDGDPTVTPYCGDPNALSDGRFPVAVPAGTPFMPGGTFVWTMNKTYPQGYGAALQALGLGDTFNPKSNSPAEDFLGKIVEVRIEIYTDADELIAEFKFDAQRYARRKQIGKVFFGQAATGAIQDPVAGVDLSAAQSDRLPTIGFPVLPTAPLASGTYYAAVIWTFSDSHWDGLGVSPRFNYIPAGDFWYGSSVFRVP